MENKTMYQHSLKRIFALLMIFFSLFASPQIQAAVCASTSSGNWSTIIGWSCGHVPTANDNVELSLPVTLDQDVTTRSILIGTNITLNAGNYTLTLSSSVPILMYSGSTFNPGTSTVKMSDADHTLNISPTFYNLQWETSLTAPRTLTINGTIGISNMLNIDGTATNPVTLAGTGNFSSSVTVNNCAGKPATMTNVTCNPPVSGGATPVPAPIDSGMALFLTFLGVIAITAWKRKKWLSS